MLGSSSLPRSISAYYRMILLASFCSALTAGCGGGPTPSPTPTLSSITVAPQSGSSATTYTSDTLQLVATATYSNGSTQDITSTAAWSSSSVAVATVSASGLVTGVSAGQANISAAVTGVSGSESITIDPKALTAIGVSPMNPTLAIGLSQQFIAVGTYNDGSVSTLTSNLNWSSSDQALASVTSSGVVTTLAQGAPQIIASSGGIQGSTTITIPNATGGLVLINDQTDSRILAASNSDQSTLTFFGNRNSNGIPNSITGFRRLASDGSWENYSLDSQARVTSIITSDNSQFLLNWTSNTSAIVTAISSDGKTTISGRFGSTQSSANSPKKSSQDSGSGPCLSGSSEGSSNTLINVHVTSCNGKVNEDDASVTITPNSILGGPIQACPVGGGTGTYLAYLPTGPTNSTLSTIAEGAGEALTFVCEAFGNAETAVDVNSWAT